MTAVEATSSTVTAVEATSSTVTAVEATSSTMTAVEAASLAAYMVISIDSSFVHLANSKNASTFAKVLLYKVMRNKIIKYKISFKYLYYFVCLFFSPILQ